MKIKIKVITVTPHHVHIVIFSGQEGETMCSNGQLCFSHKEWKTFVNTMVAGAITTITERFQLELDDRRFKDWEEKNIKAPWDQLLP